jgi:hypothetical protein
VPDHIYIFGVKRCWISCYHRVWLIDKEVQLFLLARLSFVRWNWRLICRLHGHSHWHHWHDDCSYLDRYFQAANQESLFWPQPCLNYVSRSSNRRQLHTLCKFSCFSLLNNHSRSLERNYYPYYTHFMRGNYLHSDFRRKFGWHDNNFEQRHHVLINYKNIRNLLWKLKPHRQQDYHSLCFFDQLPNNHHGTGVSFHINHRSMPNSLVVGCSCPDEPRSVHIHRSQP